MTALLEVKDLTVQLATDDGVVRAVDGVSYTLAPRQTLGIVGESGSGKSVSSLAVMGLTRFFGGARVTGAVHFGGRDLLRASADELRALRGRELAMIFQDPLSSLHPYRRVADQLVEAVRLHADTPRRIARRRAVDMLGLVGIPEPARRIDAFPHELSGGMRQRVMIAMALINEPKLVIADEPTTALDVTVQSQILRLIARLQRELGMAMLLITHDLGVVAQVTDEIAVMYAGRIVEHGPTRQIFHAPEHPYTWGLLRSMPRLDLAVDALVPIPRPPSLLAPPSGCRFHPRCPYAEERHAEVEPQLAGTGSAGHVVACLRSPEQRRAAWAVLARGGAPEQALAAMGEGVEA